MQLIHTKIEPHMKTKMQSICKDFHFANMSEFIRDSIRKNIETYSTQQALQLLEKNFKSMDGKRLSQSQRAKEIHEFLQSKKLR
jgi:Arc/MetJ-type ribon-helix-helix transcriptional regulator